MIMITSNTEFQIVEDLYMYIYIYFWWMYLALEFLLYIFFQI